MHAQTLILVVTIRLASVLLASPWSSSDSIESFLYAGCTQPRYSPGTPYESNLNSILASFVNSASTATFHNFKISLPGSTQSDVLYGLFQCRGDLGVPDCRNCVASAVSRLGTYCVGASGGALQLEGCFIRYDNASFVGAVDKSVVYDKCGPRDSPGDSLTRRDAVLAYLGSPGQYFRVGGSGNVQGAVQCVQDLSMNECEDCLSEAIQRLRSECGTSRWGDMFLGKCYARYSSTTSKGGKLGHGVWWWWWFMVVSILCHLRGSC